FQKTLIAALTGYGKNIVSDLQKLIANTPLLQDMFAAFAGMHGQVVLGPQKSGVFSQYNGGNTPVISIDPLALQTLLTNSAKNSLALPELADVLAHEL